MEYMRENTLMRLRNVDLNCLFLFGMRSYKLGMKSLKICVKNQKLFYVYCCMY